MSSDSEFFDGSDNGEGLPATFTVPTEEVQSIMEIENMVNIEIDRSRTRSNHLNKMMRLLIARQKDVQKQTRESYSVLSAQIDKQMSNLKDTTPRPHATPPHSPIEDSRGGDNYFAKGSPTSSAGDGDTTPPDPTIIDTSSDLDSNASTPPDPAVIDISPDEPYVAISSNDDLEVNILPERVAAALRKRGIPEDLKVNFETHPIYGPRLSVTRKTRLEGKAEQRVQENLHKLAAGFSLVMGWPKPLPYIETFTGDAEASNCACDCIVIAYI